MVLTLSSLGLALTPGPSISKPQLVCKKSPPTRIGTVVPRWPPAGKIYEATGASARSAALPQRRIAKQTTIRRVMGFSAIARGKLQQVVDDSAIVHDADRPAFGSVKFLVRVDAEQVVH